MNFNAPLNTQFVRLIPFYLSLPTVGPYWLRFGAQTSQSALGKKKHSHLRNIFAIIFISIAASLLWACYYDHLPPDQQQQAGLHILEETWWEGWSAPPHSFELPSAGSIVADNLSCGGIHKKALYTLEKALETNRHYSGDPPTPVKHIRWLKLPRSAMKRQPPIHSPIHRHTTLLCKSPFQSWRSFSHGWEPWPLFWPQRLQDTSYLRFHIWLAIQMMHET